VNLIESTADIELFFKATGIALRKLRLFAVKDPLKLFTTIAITLMTKGENTDEIIEQIKESFDKHVAEFTYGGEVQAGDFSKLKAIITFIKFIKEGKHLLTSGEINQEIIELYPDFTLANFK